MHIPQPIKNASCCIEPETYIHTWHKRCDAFLPYLKSAVSEKKGNYCIYAHRKSNITQEFNKPKFCIQLVLLAQHFSLQADKSTISASRNTNVTDGQQQILLTKNTP